jgi:hypothetical protein
VARVGALDLEGSVNFSLDDRHRSLRRFVMNALGSPPWVVRTERQPVQDDERPVAVVEVTSPVATTQARATLPQGDVRRTQTFTLTLYPVIEATAAESRQLAAQTAELLLQALGAGMSDDAGGVLSYPERIPVYDFQAVPVKGALRAGPADPYGHLTVEDYPVRPIQDPDDPLRWTVACDLRVSFWQAGLLTSRRSRRAARRRARPGRCRRGRSRARRSRRRCRRWMTLRGAGAACWSHKLCARRRIVVSLAGRP